MEIVPADERVIRLTNLGRVHKVIEDRIVNSADGGIDVVYIKQDGGMFHLARVDMAADGKVYLILWNRGNVLPPIGAMMNFSEEMMTPLLHRIQHFLDHGHE